MPLITQQTLQAYRAATYRLRPEARVRTPEQAIEFVNARGFIYF